MKNRKSSETMSTNHITHLFCIVNVNQNFQNKIPKVDFKYSIHFKHSVEKASLDKQYLNSFHIWLMMGKLKKKNILKLFLTKEAWLP